MMASPKFTVITPWLPGRNSIKRASACVDNQDYSNWEHIIMIDNPNGRLPEGVKSDPRRKVINCPEAHKTYGHTCVHDAWEYATGDWIVYLDDDDILYEYCLSTIEAAVRGRSEEWGYFNILRLGHPFLNIPPACGSITGGQIFHRKYVAGNPVRWCQVALYEGDWELIERVLLEHPYITIERLLGALPEHHHGQLFDFEDEM